MAKITKTGAYQNAHRVLCLPISASAKKILTREELMPKNQHNDYIMYCINQVIDCYFNAPKKTEELETKCSKTVDLILEERGELDNKGLPLKLGNLNRATNIANEFLNKNNEMQK